jgi:hypothetical protein
MDQNKKYNLDRQEDTQDEASKSEHGGGYGREEEQRNLQGDDMDLNDIEER